MAYSQVGILKIALIRCGQSVLPASINEESLAARTAKVVWDHVRDEVLSIGVPWNFAKKTVALAKDTTAPDDYEYRYAKPEGCLGIIGVTQEDIPVAYVERGDYLYTDVDNSDDDILMEYVSVVSDYTKWSAPFVNAFAFRMAAELAPVLEMSDANDLLQKYQLALFDAMAHNQRQDYIKDDPKGSSSWKDAGR